MKFVLASTILSVAFAMVMACDLVQIQQCTKVEINRIQNAQSHPSSLTIEKICQIMRDYVECIRPAVSGCPGDFSMPMNMLKNFNGSPYNCRIHIDGLFPNVDDNFGNNYPSNGVPYGHDDLASGTTCDAHKIKQCNLEMYAGVKKAVTDGGLYQNVCKVINTWADCVNPVFANCPVDSTTLNKLNKQLDIFNEAPYNCDVQHIGGGSGVPAVSLLCLVVAAILAWVFN